MQDPQTTAYLNCFNSLVYCKFCILNCAQTRPVQLLWGWTTKDWLLAWSCSCGSQQSSSPSPRGHTARGGRLLTSCHKPQPVRGTQLAATQCWGKHTQPSVLSAAPHIPFPLFSCAHYKLPSPCAYNTLLFVYPHYAGFGSPLPHSSPTIHHSSPSCSLLPRSLPTHKPKYPHAVPILTSSSCFPNLPRCWLAASAPLLILPGSSTLCNGPCSLLSKLPLSSQHSCHSNTFWT